MKHLTRSVITALLLTICGVLTIAHAVDAPNSVEQLSAEYRRAAPNQPKRNVALRAIDAGIIREGASITLAEQLFGKDFVDPVKLEPDGSGYGIVRFEAPVPNSITKDGLLASGYYRGWYLVIYYGTDKRITRYKLSDEHK